MPGFADPDRYTHYWPFCVIWGEESIDEYIARDQAFHEELVAHGTGCGCQMRCGPHVSDCDCHNCAPERHTYIVWDFRHEGGRACTCYVCRQWNAWLLKQLDA